MSQDRDTVTIGDEHLLPFERAGADSGEDPADKLFSLLESEEDQPGGDESEGDDEGAAKPKPKKEPESTESDEDDEEAGDGDESDEDDEGGEPAGEGERGEGDEEDLDALYERLRAAGYKRRVKVAGEEQEVPLDELDAGYSRTADYTRKTTETAKERDAFRQAREKYDAGLAELQQRLEQARPPKRNADEWDKLKRDDPDGFVIAWAEHQQQQEAENAVNAERESVARQRAADDEKAWNEYVDAQVALLHKAVPEFADPEKGPVAKRRLSEYLTGPSYGFTADELKMVADHRLYRLAEKARRYDETVDKAKGKIRDGAQPRGEAPKPGGKPLPPGGRKHQGLTKSKDPIKVMKAKQARLAKSGGSHDVAEDLMFDILGAEDSLRKRR